MLYEPLKNKKQKMEKDILKSNDKNINDKSDFYQGFKKGVDDSFILFASYIDLFKRYKDNVKLLMNEQKDIWEKFVKYYETQSDMNTSNYLSKYNNWLFDYMFHDVNSMDSDNFLSFL